MIKDLVLEKRYIEYSQNWLSAVKFAETRRKSALRPSNGSLYHYAGNNPVKYTDPDGKSIFGKALGIGCYVAAGVVVAAGTAVAITTAGTTVVVVAPAATALATKLTVAGTAILATDYVTEEIGENLANAKSNNESSASAAMPKNGAVSAAAGSPAPLPQDPNDDDKNKYKSTNQMQQDVNKGKAPKSVERVHKGNTAMKGEQDHVHFKDGNALNRNGTWKEGAGRPLTNAEQQWLKSGGFTIPE